MIPFQMVQLMAVPQRKREVWQGALIRIPSWTKEEGREPYRAHAALWVCASTGQIGPPELHPPEEAGFDRMTTALVSFATASVFGGYRPGRVQVRDPALADRLRPILSEAQIEVEHTPDLPALDEAVAGLSEHMLGGPLPPGPLSGEGVTVETMRSFAEAAGAFFEAQPWRMLTSEDLIEIQAPAPPSGMRFLTVLGAAGVFGLGFYGDPEECWRMHRMKSPARWLASRKHGVWTLMFDDMTGVPFADLDLWQDHQLPLACAEAYPVLHCRFPGDRICRADAARLAWLEAVLRALAASAEPQIDAGQWTVEVAASTGPAQVTLAIPDLLKPPTPQELYQRGFQPDRRAMEQMHAHIGRFIESKTFATTGEMNAAIQKEFAGMPLDPTRFPPRNALEQAQELCYQAFDSIGRRQLQLARQALALCPDCADAYVLLAERSSDPAEAAELYAQGVAAGERALGKETFEREAGRFWGLIQTRPYMRARLGLADCLAATESGHEAVEHYRELLRLNPGDNQGVRYLYLPLLIKLGLDAEAARFMNDSEDEVTALWAYMRALLAYRLEGESAAAGKELRKAIKLNSFVVPLLLKASTNSMPPHYALGSREEAVVCAEELREAFRSTPGAMKWLRLNSSAAGSRSPGPNQNRRTRDLNRNRRAQERKRRR